MKKIWIKESLDLLKNLAGRMNDEEGAAELTKLLGRTITKIAFRRQRQILGIKKEGGRGVCKLCGEKKYDT